MGSIAGRSALPFLGAYAMSKFALEAMADALRVELAPWGIHVVDRRARRRSRRRSGRSRSGRSRAAARGGRAVRRAARAVRRARRGALGLARGARRDRGDRRRARAHGAEAEDALPGRPGREAPRAGPAPPRPAARPGPDALPVRLLSSAPGAAPPRPCDGLGSRPWATRSSSLDDLGEGYGFRKIRAALGVTAFGVNAIVYPPHYDGPNHYHDTQDELYFVHRGTATFGSTATSTSSRRAGSCTSSRRRRAASRTTPTTSSSLLIVGGKGGYVERDGQLVSPEDLAKRQGLEGEHERPDDGHAADAADAAAALRARTTATRRSSPGCPTGASTAHVRARRRGGARARRRARRTSASQRGDRVATLCWNHHQHHEAYLGIPCGGFVLHTLNLRLHPNDLALHRDARRRQGRDRRPEPAAAARAVPRPRRRSSTSSSSRTRTRSCSPAPTPTRGATPSSTRTRRRRCVTRAARPGMPKGVLYSHRSTMLHTLGVAAGNPMGLGVGEEDAILPVVPMFHANAWGYPYLATMIGAKLVYPGPFLDPESLLDDFVAGAASPGRPACRRSGSASSRCSTRSRPVGPLAAARACSSAARPRRAR